MGVIPCHQLVAEEMPTSPREYRAFPHPLSTPINGRIQIVQEKLKILCFITTSGKQKKDILSTC